MMLCKWLPVGSTLLTLFMLSACAGDIFRHDRMAMGTEAALKDASQRLEKAPQDKRTRILYANQRYQRINDLFKQTDKAVANGDAAQAGQLLDEVLALDPENPRALATQAKLESMQVHREQIAEARLDISAAQWEKAKKGIRKVLLENPEHKEALALMRLIDEKLTTERIAPRKLKPAGTGRVTLEFRDASLRNIFEVISKTSGINFVLDPGLKPDLKASIFVKDASVEEVIDFLVMMHQLGKKVLTENSLLIYPQNKAGQYEDLVLRTFYLNHADAKQTLNLIKSMMPVKETFVDEKLNMLSIKASYEQLRDIEKLIVDEDIPDPEVLLDVEVLEVRRSRLTELGLNYPDTFSILSSQTGTGVTPTWRDLQDVTGSRVGVSPLPSLKMLRIDGESNLLANPRIRVKNREKAKIHIGDKIPIPVTTVGSGNNNFVGQSANYLDVGLKLDVEPRVMLNSDVSIKLTLEVSNATYPSGSVFPTIGTRNTSTVLMTGDGETQVLAGLINDEERKSTRKVPGLADIPLLGRLFGAPNTNQSKTEIVLLITPHVVRNVQRPEAYNMEFYGGTANRSAPVNINPAASMQLNNQPATPAPATTESAATTPAEPMQMAPAATKADF